MSLLQQEGGRGVRILSNQDAAQRLARILDSKQRIIGVRLFIFTLEHIALLSSIFHDLQQRLSTVRWRRRRVRISPAVCACQCTRKSLADQWS